jgi:collagen type I/II/III/V/XI/XXIV/XXVII alpha
MTKTLSGTYANRVTLVSASYDPTTITSAGRLNDGLAVYYPAGWQVLNQGTIQGSSFGIYLSNGGGVTNQNGGSIGGVYGISGGAGGALTVANAGSIAGTADAVKFAAGFANRLVIDPGAVFNGSVDGGNTIGAAALSTLELASGASTGTLTGFGTQFADFAQVAADAGAHWTLDATDTIESGVALTNAGTLGGGIRLAGGVLSNAATGTATGSDRAAVYGRIGGRATLVNAGTIANTGFGKAVDFYAGGSVTNQSGGTIVGSGGIYAGVNGGTGLALTVENAGSITATNAYGIVLYQGGSVTNQAGGTISATDEAIYSAGGALTVVNDGRIASHASFAFGLYARAGGSVTNHAGATISGYYGVGAGGGALTVVNAGSIIARSTVTSSAVRFAAGYTDLLVIDPGAVFAGSVNGNNLVGAAHVSTLELASGTFPGTMTGIGTQFVNFARIAVDTGAQWTLAGANAIAAGATLTNDGTLTDSGTLTNAGTIGGGVRLAPGGILSNASTGTVTASGPVAVYGMSGGTATVVNAGSIAAPGLFGAGVTLNGGGSVTNQSSGRIDGSNGIEGGQYGALTVVNAGRITGTTDAILFTSGHANRLVIDPGAVFTGTVDGGNTISATAASTLELAAGTGTLSGIGTQFVNFAQTTIDTGASWSLTGSNTLAAGTTITNTGTLTLSNATLYDTGTEINNGTLLIDASTLTLTGLTGSGTAAIGSGGTLDILGSVGAGETIAFGGSGGVLTFDPTRFAGEISFFGPANAMNLTGVTDASLAGIVNGNTLEIQRTGHAAIDLTLAADSSSAISGFSVVSGGTVVTDEPPCFLHGTRISTVRGEIPVELLAVGDRVVTLSGSSRPVSWIGHRTLDLTRHPAPHRAEPICIRAHAFASGAPNRDLFLSPEHAVLQDGVLVPVRLLVNGASIQRVSGRRSVTYYHVELETHDILLAENLAVESYLETGNRGIFENAGHPLLLHPDLTNDQARRVAESCAPFVDDPEQTEPIWRALAARAERLGLVVPPLPETTDDPALCLIVDGRRVAPVSVMFGKHVFVVPACATTVRLRSRGAMPSETAPWVSDDRRLGVLLRALTVRSGADVVAIPLDHPCFGEGWWQTERHGSAALRRWTDGDALVPMPEPATGTCLLEVEVAATMAYPLARAATQLPSIRRSA